jgi:glucokinase
MSGSLLLGIEIGGTKLQLGVGRGDGRLIQAVRRRVDPAAGAEGIRRQIIEAFGELVAGVGCARTEIAAAGIGFGGPVDSQRGIVLTSNQIRGWDNFPLAEWARSTLAIDRVDVENDADTAGLGEARYGAGRGADPLLYVTIGSGIGGGLIIGGGIYRGTGRGAAEIGQLWVCAGHGGPPERLEQVASGWAIAAALGTTGPASAETVAAAAEQGDPRCMAILARAREAFAFALANAIALVGPRRIVLGGGVSLIGEKLWFAPLRESLDALVFSPFRGTYDLVVADLGEAVVVRGAIALAGSRARRSD